MVVVAVPACAGEVGCVVHGLSERRTRVGMGTEEDGCSGALGGLHGMGNYITTFMAFVAVSMPWAAHGILHMAWGRSGQG
jgi:hypothetical protein